MTLPKFDYVVANSLEEASQLAAEKAGHAMVMAGGTDVIVMLQSRGIPQIDTVIDLKPIQGMDQIAFEEGDGLHVGALAKLFALQSSPVVQEHIPAVADAAHYVASAQIRRKGTMAGNICNASPSADTAPILVAMNATVKTTQRDIPIDEFFKGVKRTCLAPGEIVTEIVIPELKSGEGSAYFKHSVRKAMDLAIIGVAAWVKMDGKKVADCRIAMGGVGITPLRAKEAEALLTGQVISDELLEKVGTAAAESCHPISDVRASAEYRTDMVRVYTKRAIKKAIETMKA